MMPSANKSSKWGTKQIDSVQSVYDALTYLNLPHPSQEVINIIASGSGKGKFKSALEECLQITGKAPEPDTKRFICGLIQCVSSMYMKAVNESLGYENVPVEAFIIIGQLEGVNGGMAFYSSVKSAITSNDPNQLSSLTFVHEKLTYAMDKIGCTLSLSVPPTPSDVLSRSTQKLTSQHSQNAISLGAAQEEPTVTSSEVEEREEKNDYSSTHAYGAKAAVCFNATKSLQGHFCVTVDGALSIKERVYDWKNAIHIQLGYKELPFLYGVLVGWSNSIKFDAHGEKHDKIFEIERQKDKVYVKILAKGQTLRAIPIGPMDVYPIMNLVLAQIIKEAPEEIRNYPDIIIQQMKLAHHINPIAEDTRQ